MTQPCQYATFRPSDRPSDNVPVGARSVGRHRVPPHWRDNSFVVKHVAVLWTISGCGQVIVNGATRRCPAEHLAIYLPGMQQEFYTGDSEWEYCWWTMDGPSAAAMTTGYGLAAGVHPGTPPPLALISQLLEQIVRADRAGEIDAGITALQLLAAAAKAVQTPSQPSIDDPLVADAVTIIHDRFQDVGFGVEQLAAELAVDRSTLSRHFHRSTGVTVIHYLTSMRIQTAMSLLRDSKLAIGAVANRCGYADPGYFRRVFVKRMGQSPSEFRRHK